MTEFSADHSLILASASPRRAQLLKQIGVPFSSLITSVEETRLESESPQDYAQRLAWEKASAGRHRLGNSPQRWFLGADTLVLCDQQVLEKPRNQADFRSMMQRLSAREHLVLTAICLRGASESFTELVQTQVRFRPLNRALIDAYWQTGEPTDKAGGYGIQGMGALLVQSIKGSYSNVVGLPLEALAPMLERAKIAYWQLDK